MYDDDGSSPHERGTGPRRLAQLVLDRFIPARAGNSVRWARPCRPEPVHPRTSGEQCFAASAAIAVAGSSPHERGTAACARRWGAQARFIPARAGNRRPTACCSGMRPVHPRTSGEQCPAHVQPPCDNGSSPHERGTAGLHPRTATGLRFIPARAGNRRLSAPSVTTEPVHPRTSGEQSAISWRYMPEFGSSPHERGTGAAPQRGGQELRFIPARAGNRPAWPTAPWNSAVHPRTSGEQSAASAMLRTMTGSSPHERGTGRPLLLSARRTWFIPARAGNRSRSSACPEQLSVHPRTSGEQGTRLSLASRKLGSSPHERGTGLCKQGAAGWGWFIPARAGNSSRSDR